MAYGDGDASFQAAGGEAGLLRLVDDFYDLMETRPYAATIRAMHPPDLTVARDKLARFLCGWLGGPKRYQERYGSISIPGSHAHLDVDADARDGDAEARVGQGPLDEADGVLVLELIEEPEVAQRRRVGALLQAIEIEVVHARRCVTHLPTQRGRTLPLRRLHEVVCTAICGTCACVHVSQCSMWVREM